MRARITTIGAGTAVAVSLISSVMLRAQGGAQTGPPAPRVVLPTVASSVATRPDAHVGANVSMIGLVDAVLSKTVFTVDQVAGANSGKDVLVIAPYLNAPLATDARLTVLGEVFAFDPAEAIKRAPRGYTLDLAPAAAATYQGRPAIVATSVITEDLVDVGKRLPPPLSPEEIVLRDAMIAINTNNGGLRTGLATPDAARVKEQIAALKKAFTAAESFFTARKAADAVGWSADALKAIASMEIAANAARWDDVRAGATTVGGLCTPCHTARRQREDDGTFRFRGEQ